MKQRVEAVINFQNGTAEVSLPKGATDIYAMIKNQSTPYLCATADSDETETEKYLLSSYAEKQTFDEEEGIKFLKKIFHLPLGNLYWYYKKC